jgi:lysophospholipase L1-like esterase
MKSPKSKTHSPEKARSLGYLLTSGAALVVVTCAGAARTPEPAMARVSHPVPKSSASAQTLALPAPEEEAVSADKLGRFRQALSALATHERKTQVRVLWLGDSHTAADFWTDAVRKPLQEKYGTGGVGFVHVGLNAYRHGRVKFGREGAFRAEPKQPSLWTRQEDGVFGLAGIRVVPMDTKSRATLELTAEAGAPKEMTWDLAFRLPTTHSRFRVTSAGEVKSVDATKFPIGVISHLAWKAKSDATIAVEGASGEPELLGATVETGTPGVVVDTLGINGARVATPLAWDGPAWVKEAARRQASLVVLAYGTNEAGDQLGVEHYGPQVEGLVALAREAAPDADCLVVGPTDREAADFTTLPRVAAIDDTMRAAAVRAGCAYFSAFKGMGGDGGLKRWADQNPPLAGSDHVHLTPRGYQELGGKIADMILGTAK